MRWIFSSEEDSADQLRAYSGRKAHRFSAPRKEIEAKGGSLNRGRHMGDAPGEEINDEDFKVQLEALNKDLETPNAQTRAMEATIVKSVAEVLES